jgi:hypothetical protein
MCQLSQQIAFAETTNFPVAAVCDRRFVFCHKRREQLQMVRHQNIFTDKYTAHQSGLTKLPKIFVDFGVRETSSLA